MAGASTPPTVVGDVTIAGRTALAPVAGYTEYPYRAVVARFGCPYAVTPLISAEGLLRRNENTLRLLVRGDDDVPVVAAQIFGSRPAAMAEAAKAVTAAGFPVVDLNIGCPARKIRKQQAGAALLGDMVALRKVARAVIAASSGPVTAKMRLGRNASDPAPRVAAKLLAEEGIAALTVHGRTIEQGFAGPVNREAIAEIVEAVAVPVWANGGVASPPDAAALLEDTGAAGVMVGRAAVRRPYLIHHIETYLTEGRAPAAPSRAELAQAIMFHFDRAASLRGEDNAARQFRKHLLAYLQDMPETKPLRPRAGRVASRRDVAAVLEALQELPPDGP